MKPGENFQRPKPRSEKPEEMFRRSREMQALEITPGGEFGPDEEDGMVEVYYDEETGEHRTVAHKPMPPNLHKPARKVAPKENDWFFDRLADAFGMKDEDPALTESMKNAPKPAPKRDWFFDGLADAFGMSKGNNP